MATLLGAAGVAHKVCDSLDQAVKVAAALAQPADDVLLSPGFSSLDQFEGYADRGQSFVNFVEALQVPDQS